jgi:hypothetical protein
MGGSMRFSGRWRRALRWGVCAVGVWGVAGCGGESTPAPSTDASVAAAPRDPAQWVPAFAARLNQTLRAHAEAQVPADLFLRARPSKKFPFQEPTILEAVYGGADRTFQFVGPDGLTEAGRRLTERLAGLQADGLRPTRLHVDEHTKIRRRFEQTLRDLEAVALPPPLTATEVEALLAAARALPGEATEAALLERVLSEGGPLPAWSSAWTALRDATQERAAARLRWEIVLADGLLYALRLLAPGNVTTEARLARREVAPAPPPALESTPAAHEERGGLADDREDEAVPPVPAGASLPPVLADRKAFVTERLRAGLARASTAAEVDAVLDAAQPKHPQYAPLKSALARHRKVAEAGGYVKFEAAQPALGAGSRHPLVEKVQRRLAQDDLLQGPPSGVFDAATVAAVEAFQHRVQLDVTGRIDKRTWAELTVPVGQRIRKLDRALDTVRASRVDDDTYFVTVNIPDFHLEVWADGQRLMRQRVVVGKSAGTRCDEKTKKLTLAYATPTLSAEMSQLVFAPYWLVTKDIKEKEYDPERARDPMYYEKNGYEVIERGRPSEWVRQLPGPKNSLGFVKMLFPNEHAVYLHDTPQRAGFERKTRAFSHGCVRLNEPRPLAQLLLERDGQWEPQRFDDLYARWEEIGRLTARYDEDKYRLALRQAIELQTPVNLKSPVPVHLEYYTARVDERGRLEFLNDLYELDKGKWKLENAPPCVPDSQRAKDGAEGVADEVERLEKEAAALVARIARLTKRGAALATGDEKRQGLWRRLKGLGTFAERHRTLAQGVLDAQEKLDAKLEKRKGEWTKELQGEAVRVRRLVDALEKSAGSARRTCDEVEAAL